MFCNKCGREIENSNTFCNYCGAPTNLGSPQVVVNNQNYQGNYMSAVSDKDWLTTLLLCIFVGGLGIHRFYVGKTGTGILWLFTLGCFGIGTIIDLITIITGGFTDNLNRPLNKK